MYRVLVTGAAGQIGYSLVMQIAKGDVFGPETPVCLILFDIPMMHDALTGVQYELQDCALPTLKEVKVTVDEKEAFEGIDYAFLVGAMPRKQGMERKDLLAANVKIFKTQGQALAQYAKPTTKTGEVKNVIIWGNHSATQVPDVGHATVLKDGHAVKAYDAVNDTEWLHGPFISIIQKRGAVIIEKRKLSSAMSAAKAACDHVRDWHKGTREGEWVSMAVPSDGSYGIPKGLVFSFPCRVSGGQWSIVQGLQWSDFIKGKIEITRKELEEERDEALKACE
ncbi:unnamed protein product [Dracunculus medinensis]|uniref:Malate dehydrogenase, cytoplasmic n=1 Tax=Dracunculus medinensis TaxID=318479 RepID=A0A158Q2J3_DRAME|nr:unnamed protein product [Dracunculus medinensis]